MEVSGLRPPLTSLTTSATPEGEDHQAPRAQGAACLWLLRSRSDQVRTAPLLGTR